MTDTRTHTPTPDNPPDYLRGLAANARTLGRHLTAIEIEAVAGEFERLTPSHDKQARRASLKEAEARQ